jgi:tripartite-type tricarboxylate transporter receptor subunit TctC
MERNPRLRYPSRAAQNSYRLFYCRRLWRRRADQRLNLAINAGLADPRLKARLDEIGITALPGSPGDFGRLIAAETERLGKVIRAANIKPE